MSVSDKPQNPTTIVEGGGFRLWTADPVTIAVVRRCAELARQNADLKQHNIELHHEMTARYRTLRRDISQIKRRVCTHAE